MYKLWFKYIIIRHYDIEFKKNLCVVLTDALLHIFVCNSKFKSISFGCFSGGDGRIAAHIKNCRN